MLTGILEYGIAALVVSVSLLLLGSKVLAEKFVALGLLPRAFLGLVPALKRAVRVVGVLLILGGLVGLGAANGWVNPEIIKRFGLAATLIVTGAILLIFTARE